jgi:phosphorylated adapter RNA export protein
MRGSRQKEQQKRDEQKKKQEAAIRQQERAMREAITTVAEKLGETEPRQREIISAIVGHLGIEPTMTLLHETVAIEDQGGLLTADGTRRRTPGGVFMMLVKKKLTENGKKDLIKQIF